MIFAPSKDRLLEALSGEKPLNKILNIATLTESQTEQLNAIRSSKGWDTRETRIITMNQTDVTHILKRIYQDKLTPEEVTLIAEYALSNESIVTAGNYNRAMIEYPDKIEIDGNHFTPRAVLMDGLNWRTYRLYGLIPKGWRGRK